MKRHHVYRPPRGNRFFNSVVIGLGGLLFTFAVFFLIPLMRKLEQGLAKEKQELVANIASEPPEEYESPEEEPELEEEPEDPPEMAEADEEISVEAIDLPDLGAGTGGRVLLNISSALVLSGNEDDFGSGEIDQEPTPSSSFDPQVPNSVMKILAKRGAVRVVVSALVDERGLVSEASISTSSGIAKLDEAALKALQRWKFKPAIRGGRKARARITQQFNFRVK